jgi:hypothetical protein
MQIAELNIRDWAKRLYFGKNYKKNIVIVLQQED